MLEGSRNASQYKIYSGDNLPVSKFSNSYSISFWVYINDYKYSLKENKYIIMRGNKDEQNDSPIIYLTPYQNNLVVKVKLQSQEDPTEFETDDLKTESHNNVNQTLKEDSTVSELNNSNNQNTNNQNTNSVSNNVSNNNTSNPNNVNSQVNSFANVPNKDNFNKPQNKK